MVDEIATGVAAIGDHRPAGEQHDNPEEVHVAARIVGAGNPDEGAQEQHQGANGHPLHMLADIIPQFGGPGGSRDDGLPGIGRLAAGFGRLMQGEEPGGEGGNGRQNAKYQHPPAGHADGAFAQVPEHERQDLYQDADKQQCQREVDQRGMEIRLNQRTCHGYSRMSALKAGRETRLSREVSDTRPRSSDCVSRIPRRARVCKAVRRQKARRHGGTQARREERRAGLGEGVRAGAIVDKQQVRKLFAGVPPMQQVPWRQAVRCIFPCTLR
eukprot:TRINITY_DN15438_c0_g1_i2.p2 TRINITY_DN15438_c0_g1~~TRINITY_DN15438_c0_g1_i2.p2  ORF type:complete len:270 (+),score=7.61 TRINITY_DN15438_c0_g1_i2:834-1643(+)